MNTSPANCSHLLELSCWASRYNMQPTVAQSQRPCPLQVTLMPQLPGRPPWGAQLRAQKCSCLSSRWHSAAWMASSP